MIAKIPPKRRDAKSSFKALTDYCLGVTGHSAGSVLHVGMQNLNSPSTAAVEMESVAIGNVRCKNPAFHFILSWREMEAPTKEQVDEAVGIALRELDLEECQALWALQSDTENLHVHVAVNRVHPETRRAIQPAGNWTKKALEAAARKIEIAQGWEVERSGRYHVDSLGNVFEKEAAERREPVSQKARDIEAHTGAESLERTAKREVASILENAASWEELHEELARHGCAIEKKGSGAILRFDGEECALKLSTVSRKCSLKKLEERLGAYREANQEVMAQNQSDKPETAARKESEIPAEKVRHDERLLTSWERYCAERAAYFEAKGKAIKELKELHKQEFQEMVKRQRAERKKLYSESWRGHGKELNRLRSLYAYAQQKERLALREEQQDDMDDLRSHYLKRFPSYKRWLADQKTEELFTAYRYPGQSLLTPEQSGVTPRPHRPDLRDYSARNGAGSSVLYFRTGALTADFSDMGKRITLNQSNLDEVSVAAAMQLANQKWGATQITGDDAYKELCVSVAVKYGLKIANVDLAAEVERRRAALRQGVATKEEIAALGLVDGAEAIIHTNPRKDNQHYPGPVVHVDTERGFCVQKFGNRTLYVHKLDDLETAPRLGEDVRISYVGAEKARVVAHETRRRARGL